MYYILQSIHLQNYIFPSISIHFLYIHVVCAVRSQNCQESWITTCKHVTRHCHHNIKSLQLLPISPRPCASWTVPCSHRLPANIQRKANLERWIVLHLKGCSHTCLAMCPRCTTRNAKSSSTNTGEIAGAECNMHLTPSKLDCFHSVSSVSLSTYLSCASYLLALQGRPYPVGKESTILNKAETLNSGTLVCHRWSACGRILRKNSLKSFTGTLAAINSECVAIRHPTFLTSPTSDIFHAILRAYLLLQLKHRWLAITQLFKTWP